MELRTQFLPLLALSASRLSRGPSSTQDQRNCANRCRFARRAIARRSTKRIRGARLRTKRDEDSPLDGNETVGGHSAKKECPNSSEQRRTGNSPAAITTRVSRSIGSLFWNPTSGEWTYAVRVNKSEKRKFETLAKGCHTGLREIVDQLLYSDPPQSRRFPAQGIAHNIHSRKSMGRFKSDLGPQSYGVEGSRTAKKLRGRRATRLMAGRADRTMAKGQTPKAKR
jgi:hypothetical protein